MIKDKKHFRNGLMMTVLFLGVLLFMFTPSFNGTNAFHASDALFNSIAKGSTNYFPQLGEQNRGFRDHHISVTIQTPAADKIATLLTTSGGRVGVQGTSLALTGDLNTILASALTDAENMFYNRGDLVREKYGLPEKEAMYLWWQTLKQMDRYLKTHKDFTAAAFISEVVKRGVEVGYNFYGVQPQSAGSKFGLLSFSLIFYVVYTLWWGFSIFFLFEGIGLEMSSGSKKEV